MQGKCGRAGLAQFLHTAKDTFVKASWLLRWLRLLLVLCFFGTPIKFSPKILPRANPAKRDESRGEFLDELIKVPKL
jgi:hypothetical protein